MGFLKKLLAVLPFLAPAASSHASAHPPGQPSSPRFDIVLLGDDARLRVMDEVGERYSSPVHLVGTPARGSAASEVASAAQHAKHGIIVIDATQGPTPIIREHVQIARQVGIPSLSMLFVNVGMLEGNEDATELVELTHLEVIEVINTYGMDGDGSPAFHDARIASAPTLHSAGIGFQPAYEWAAGSPPRERAKARTRTGARLDALVYVLTPQESSATATFAPGTEVELWVDGQLARGTVSSGTLAPGSNGELALRLTSSVTAAERANLILQREGRLVGMGLVVRLGD